MAKGMNACSMLKLMGFASLAVALGLGAAAAGVDARKNPHSLPSSTVSSVLTVTAGFSAADSSDDVTQDMLVAICSHIVKHSVFEGGLESERGITCQHSVVGVPVKVCYN
jgi:hypothetical protein